jgi:ribosomal protein S18 acetylase RimI-like enzyme
VPNLLLMREPGHPAVEVPRGDFTIRPLPAEELPLVADAYFASFRGTEAEFSVEEAAADVAATAAGEYGTYQPEHSAIARAVTPATADECVGAILVVRDPPYPDVPPGLFILDLFVTPAHRGRGLGKELVLHTISRAASDALWLRVNADNAPALALYTSLGFTTHALQR